MPRLTEEGVEVVNGIRFHLFGSKGWLVDCAKVPILGPW